MKKLMQLIIFCLSMWSSMNAYFGLFDPSFNAGTIVANLFDISGDFIIGMRIDTSNDKIVVVGEKESDDPTSAAILVFNANGTPDTSFNGTGKRFDANTVVLAGDLSEYRDVAIDASGNYVATGLIFKLAEAQARGVVARYTPTGSRDTTFGGGSGFVVSPFVDDSGPFNSVAIQTDGKIVVGSNNINAFPTNELRLLRYDTAGVLDPGFGAGGTFSFPAPPGAGSTQISHIALQSDGAILVVGQEDDLRYLARVTTAGALDGGFGVGGEVIGIAGESRFVAPQSDGTIFVVEANAAGDAGNLARYTATGAPDVTFNGTGSVALPTNFVAQTLNVQSDGKLLLGGFISSLSKVVDAIIRLNSDGSLDTTFGPPQDPIFFSTNALTFESPGVFLITTRMAFQSTGGLIIFSRALGGADLYQLKRVLFSEVSGSGGGDGPVTPSTEGSLFDHKDSTLRRILRQK